MLYVLNDPPVYPPTTGEEPAASPGPVYPIPVWATPEASPTSTATIIEFPNTGSGDAFDVGGHSIGWGVVAVVLAVIIIAGYLTYARRRND